MSINGLLYVFSFTLLFTLAVFSSDPPEFSPSPSPAPELGSDDSYPVTPSSPSPSVGSPPASSPSHLSPSPASVDGSPSSSPSPSPSLSQGSDISADVKSREPKEFSSDGKESSDGMSGGKKAGVAFGVIAAACFVGFGGMLYKKRQANIRRAQYSYAARMDFI